MSLAPFLVLLSLLTDNAPPGSEAVEKSAREALAPIPGKTAFAFTEVTDAGANLLFGLRADERFAIGSSFKLFILGTLIDEVNGGRRELDDTMRLKAGLKGPPHSEMASWPIDSPVTLHTLALKMISVSDNTATDHLLYLLGRERIERMLPLMGHAEPALNRPLLSTRELVGLRDRKAGLPGLTYRKLDEAARRKFLAEKFTTVPDFEAIDFDTAAYELAEWYGSPVEMARALAWIHQHTTNRVAAAPLRQVLSVDPKIKYDPKVWSFVGFKGGSEDQLLAGNWLLQHRNGRWYTFHVYWNSPTEQVKPDVLLKAIRTIFTSIESALDSR